jgi:CheY-like chemotaxis protein/energy-coupling factor transporter ATP-binding protein EcfA2
MSTLPRGIARGPYPGLRPFAREEAFLFFGREEQIDQLLDKLDETHFLAVVGPSGSGKSSLVRAGLLPALDAGLLLAAAGARWEIAALRPGEAPYLRLAEALVRDTDWGRGYAASFVDAPDSGESSAMPALDGQPRSASPEPADACLPRAAAALEEDLRRGSLALSWRLGLQPLPEGRRLLLLIDQFEELFRGEAAAFAALLLGAASHPAVYVVITLRSERLGDCALVPDLPEAINGGLFLIPALTPAQMADAIQLPAELPQFAGSVAPDLVRQLLAEARGQTDQLPLLQHVLMRLWDLDHRDSGAHHLTSAGLEALGGLPGALNAHLDETYKALAPEQQRIARVLFCGLTEGGDAVGRDARRPVRLGEIAELVGCDWAQVAAVVAELRRPDRGFLMPPAPVSLGPDTWLDITHEALIRHWRRLADWTADEAKRAEQYLRLEAAARRERDGTDSLLQDPALQLALDWRERHQPTAPWARRYGGDFELAMAFLDASKAQRDQTARFTVGQLEISVRALRQGREDHWTREFLIKGEPERPAHGRSEHWRSLSERTRRSYEEIDDELRKLAREMAKALRGKLSDVDPNDTASKELQRLDQIVALYDAQTLAEAADRLRVFWLFLQQDETEIAAFSDPSVGSEVWSDFGHEDLTYLALIVASLHIPLAESHLTRDVADKCLDAYADIARLFWDRAPARRFGHHQTGAQVNPMTQIDPAEVLAGREILVVDDRPTSLEFLLYALRSATHNAVRITERRSLGEAVQELKEQPEKYDVVVIDLHIPGKLPEELEPYARTIDIDLNEGQALGLWLKQNRPQLPYLYLSAVPNAHLHCGVEGSGVEVLRKVDSAKGFPYRLAEFLKRAEQALGADS